MNFTYKFACVQLNSSEDLQDNLLTAERLIRQAATLGADVIATPEVTDQMLADRTERIEECFTQDAHPAIPFFSKLAQELSVTLLIGSLVIKTEGGYLYNRSFLFNREGKINTTYDKMHLCDTDLPTGQKFRESACYKEGKKAVVADLGDLQLGMSICRDLRYGRMYRALARQGANVMMIPSAWLFATGKMHWEILLRTRAIETGCFIIAPNQVGEHAGNRQTYGHSMIINPWGEIIAHTQKDKEDVIMAECDFSLVTQARKAIPCLSHEPAYVF